MVKTPGEQNGNIKEKNNRRMKRELVLNVCGTNSDLQSLEWADGNLNREYMCRDPSSLVRVLVAGTADLDTGS